jgi:hypothetical protein
MERAHQDPVMPIREHLADDGRCPESEGWKE